MSVKCPNKKYKFYQELLTAFKNQFPIEAEETVDEYEKRIDRKAFDVWYKTELASFGEWYGAGKKDSFGNPLMINLEYVNDKGDKISVFDLDTSEQFKEDEKTARTVEQLNDEKTKYDIALKKISDVLVTKIGILKNSKRGKDQAEQLSDLKKELDKLEASEAVVQFALNAIKQVATSKSRLEILIKDNKINIRNLARYKNYVSAYDVLDDILDLIEEFPENFPRISKAAISEAIAQRDFIKRYYLKSARPMVAEALAVYSTSLGKEQIEEWLANAPFDIDSINMWTHYMGDSRDPILALGAKMVDDNFQKVRQAHIAFRHDLFKVAEELEKFKGSTRDATKLFEDFLEVDLNGKRTGFIISEFKYGEFYKEKQTYLDKIEAIEKEKGTDSKEYKDARKEYWKWLRENVVQEYTKAYYDTLDQLSQEARDARDVFQLAKKEIMKKYQVPMLDKNEKFIGFTHDYTNIVDEDWERIRELNKQIRLLKSDYDEYGVKKDPAGLKIAKELRDYSKKVSDLYETVGFNKEGFEKAKKRAEDQGEEVYSKWITRNTTMKFTPEFWSEFARIMKELRGDADTSDIYEKINTLLNPYKDEDGIVDGSIVPAGVSERVAELTADIKLIKRGDAETKTVTSAQNKAKAELKKLVTFVTTSYYEAKFDEMEKIGGEEFDAWFDANHYLDHTNTWKAKREWTTMLPRDKKHIETETPNNNWFLTDVKKEYWNADYREDKGRPVPVNKWKNNQYAKLLASNPTILKYYNFYADAIEKANQMLPYQYRLGYRIPSVRKGDMARILDGGENAWSILKESIKDRFVRRKDDTEYGQLLDEEKNPINYLPVYFTADIEPEEKSYDLTAVLNMFWGMAMRHEVYSEVIDNLEGIKYQLRNRHVAVTTSDGKAITSRTKGLNNPEQIKLGVDSKSYKQFEDYLNRIVYGQMNQDLGFWNTGIGKFDRAKVVDNINAFSAYGVLAFNTLAATVNVVQGELSNQTEAAANQFFGIKDYGSAKGEYYRNQLAIINDVGRRIPISKIGLMNESFDTLGKYSQEALSPEESNAFKRNMKSDLPFFMNNIGEHRIQSQIMIAMLKKLVPKDANGEAIKDLANMYNAFTVKDGELVLDDRVKNFDEAERRKFTRQMQFVIRRLHGNYNKATSPMWQKNAILRAIGSMRKWVMPGISRRYETMRYNEFGEVMTEGMYRTTGRILIQYIKGIKKLKGDIEKLDWDKLTDTEKANIRRTVTEVCQFIVMLAAAGVLSKLADDDKKKGKKNKTLIFAAYITNRTYRELAFYTGTSALQILRSPATSVSMLENAAKLGWQLIHAPGERYKAGDRKDELKIGKQFEQLFPLKQYRRTFTYEGLHDQLSWLQ